MIKFILSIFTIFIGGLVLGLIVYSGLGSALNFLFTAGVFFYVFNNFIKVAREKKNVISWFKENFIVVIGLIVGVGFLIGTISNNFFLPLVLPFFVYVQQNTDKQEKKK